MYRILYILEQDHLIVLHELTLTHAKISARFFKVQLELVLQVPQQFEEAYRFPTDTIFMSVQLSYICPLVDFLHHPLHATGGSKADWSRNNYFANNRGEATNPLQKLSLTLRPSIILIDSWNEGIFYFFNVFKN